MTVEIRVPTLGESITEATVGQWLKAPGDAVAVDDPLVELETDKVAIEVNATAAGALAEIVVGEGETVEVGALLGTIAEGAAAATPQASKPTEGAAAAPAPAPAPAAAPASVPAAPAAPAADIPAMPAARKMAAEKGLDVSQIPGTGKDGRVTKGDVIAFAEAAPTARPAPVQAPSGPRPEAEREQRVRMTRLRKRIAERLKEAQNTAAMLTTFNEVDMTEVMALRTRYKELFQKKHGIKLGFMGLFVKACVTALKDVPAVNAEIDGTDLVFKDYCHIGVAVGTDKGLVVPVVRDADAMGIADIEKAIAGLGKKARDGKLSLA